MTQNQRNSEPLRYDYSSIKVYFPNRINQIGTITVGEYYHLFCDVPEQWLKIWYHLLFLQIKMLSEVVSGWASDWLYDWGLGMWSIRGIGGEGVQWNEQSLKTLNKTKQPLNIIVMHNTFKNKACVSRSRENISVPLLHCHGSIKRFVHNWVFCHRIYRKQYTTIQYQSYELHRALNAIGHTVTSQPIDYSRHSKSFEDRLPVYFI